MLLHIHNHVFIQSLNVNYMKGVKHFFLRICKDNGVKINIGDKWHCSFRDKKPVITIPEQKTNLDIFLGFHELAHAILHKNDKRDYDDLLSRIQIECEADNLANKYMRENGLETVSNNYTLGLIALYLFEGNEYLNYTFRS